MMGKASPHGHPSPHLHSRHEPGLLSKSSSHTSMESDERANGADRGLGLSRLKLSNMGGKPPRQEERFE